MRRNIRVIGAAVLVTAGAAMLGQTGAASAAVAATSGARTPQCHVAGNFCTTPVAYAPQVTQGLAMTATAKTANSPVIAAALDVSDVNQDWMLELIGGLPPGARRHGPAAYGPRNPAPQMADLEFSPGGLRSGLCAANVSDKLVLRHCNGSNWQIFIITASASGLHPPEFFSYFLSDVLARASGQHLALTAPWLDGSQITFTEPSYSSRQWWTESSSCVIAPRRPATGRAERGC